MEKIGLALSGGGIKSISEVPVINVLHQEGIKISYIAGTSMGSVIAALVALDLDNEILNQLVMDLEQEIQDKKVFTRPSAKILPFVKDRIQGGFVDGKVLQDIFAAAIEPYGMKMMTDVKIPLAIPAVDVVSGKIVVFVSHPDLFKPVAKDWIIRSDISIAEAVRSSCSFPFVISAHDFDDMLLVDGGIRMNLPVPLLQAYEADKIIAVTMHTDNQHFQEAGSFVSYAIRMIDLMRIEGDGLSVREADLHINIPVDDVNMFDIGKGKESFEIGEEAMKQHEEAIQLLKQGEVSSWVHDLRQMILKNIPGGSTK